MPAAMSAIEGPALHGSSARAGDRHEARLALDQQVVGLLVAVRAVGAVARDVADDDPGLHCRQALVAEAQPRRGAGGEVLHHHVGLFEHQALQHLGRLGMLHVERQAFLRAVGPDEMRGQAAHARVVAAREVAGARALDLDDAGAEVGELARRERRRDRVLEGDDGESLEGLHGVSVLVQRSVATASIVSQPSWSCAHSLIVLPSACELAVDAERVEVERRAHGLEAEGRDVGGRALAAHQVHQQRRDQRPVHDQARVALDLGDVAAVVVDAVAVEGQRRVAEQQHVVGHDLALPGGAGRPPVAAAARRRRAASPRGRRCRGTPRAPGSAAPLQRTSWRTFTNTSLPVRPSLLVTAVDGRAALDRVADADRRAELELAAGPHAPRQRHRRQEAAALGVAVGADLALPVHRQEVQPVPQRRQRRARGHAAGRMVERRGQRDHRVSGRWCRAMVSLRPIQAARSRSWFMRALSCCGGPMIEPAIAYTVCTALAIIGIARFGRIDALGASP